MFGLGSVLGHVFGGGNDYNPADQYNPILGAPGSGPGARYWNYNANLKPFNQQIANAGNLTLPQNVLNFNPANQTMGQQQGLINQLIAEGQGQGPNPAMEQLKMTTGQNIANAASQEASNRGINPALAARMAGQSAGNLNQQAAGQGALMAAQQQLAAQGQAGGLLGQQIGQQMGQAQEQGQAGLGLLQTRQSALSAQEQARQQYQNMIAGIYSGNQNTAAGVAAQNAQTMGGYGMGAMAGISSAFGHAPAMGSEGGLVDHGQINPFKDHVFKKMAMGGMADNSANAFLKFQHPDPQADFMGSSDNPMLDKSMGGISQGLSGVLSNAFGSTPFPTMEHGSGVTPGYYDSPNAMGVPGDYYSTNVLRSKGGKIQGQAQVHGDSEKNDNVPALLSPGEVVIPRSAMNSPDEAHAFLDKILAKHEGPNIKSVNKAREKYHKMNHGGEMSSCGYCMGGYT